MQVIRDENRCHRSPQMDDKKVVIGKVLTNLENPDTSLASSSFPKKGQLGFS